MSPAAGLSYVRGRTDAATIEGGSPTRESGQFGATHRSAPVRSSGPHRIRETVGSMLTAASGAVVIFCDPDNANGGGGQQANGLVFSWRASAAERIELEYTKGSTLLTARRLQASAGTTATQTLTFAAGDALALLIQWNATTLQVSSNGGVIASVSNTSAPVGLPVTFDVGSQDGATASTYFNAAYGAVLTFSAPLTAAQWVTLADLRAARPPVLGEGGTDALATSLWYGGHSLVWTIPAGGASVDLNDAVGGDYLLRDQGLINAGIPELINRAVETPLRDGSAYVDTRLRTRMLIAPLLLRAVTTIAELWTGRRELAAALNPRRGYGVLQYAPSTTVYEIDAIVESGVGYREPLGATAQLLAIVFRCDDPAWRVAARNDAVLAVPQGGWSIPWSIPWSISASSITQAVTNAGDLESYPVVEFTAGAAGATGPSVTNATTGETFRLAGLVLAAGEVLTVDMDARTATVAGVTKLGYRTSDSRMWSLEPGANSVSAAVDSGSASVAFKHFTRLIGV